MRSVCTGDTFSAIIRPNDFPIQGYEPRCVSITPPLRRVHVSILWERMSNLALTLNDHIRRLARREIKAETKTTRRLTALYRRDIAALKRQVASLRKTVTFLESQEKRHVGERPTP